MKKDDKKDIEYFKVTLVYKVRTKAQAKEMTKVLNAAYGELVDKWCGKSPKSPDDFGRKFEAIKRTAPKSKMPKNFGEM